MSEVIKKSSLLSNTIYNIKQGLQININSSISNLFIVSEYQIFNITYVIQMSNKFGIFGKMDLSRKQSALGIWNLIYKQFIFTWCFKKWIQIVDLPLKKYIFDM